MVRVCVRHQIDVPKLVGGQESTPDKDAIDNLKCSNDNGNVEYSHSV